MRVCEMVVLKQLELSVNIEFISFQTKAEDLDLWLAITKSYFKNENFEVYTEKKSKQRTLYSV